MDSRRATRAKTNKRLVEEVGVTHRPVCLLVGLGHGIKLLLFIRGGFELEVLVSGCFFFPGDDGSTLNPMADQTKTPLFRSRTLTLGLRHVGHVGVKLF